MVLVRSRVRRTENARPRFLRKDFRRTAFVELSLNQLHILSSSITNESPIGHEGNRRNRRRHIHSNLLRDCSGDWVFQRTVGRINRGVVNIMKYRCVASSPEGLVQLLAASYLRHGYFWYVTGRIKGSKDPANIDTKLVDKYQIALTARERARRKELGIANMHYVRCERWFILLATEGNHAFKQEEKKSIRDCRRVPIKFAGYSISYRRGGRTPKGGTDPKWHAHVRIDTTTYNELKAHFVGLATHRSADSLAQEFRKIGFARYAPGQASVAQHPQGGQRGAGRDRLRGDPAFGDSIFGEPSFQSMPRKEMPMETTWRQRNGKLNRSRENRVL